MRVLRWLDDHFDDYGTAITMVALVAGCVLAALIVGGLDELARVL